MRRSPATNFWLYSVTKICSSRCPLAVTRRDQIRDHAADVPLLCRVVVWSCVVSGYRHRPCFVAVVEVAEKLCGVFDVPSRVQHLLWRRKILAMEVVIDLHATHIDELSSLPASRLKGLHGGHRGLREVGFALDIECPGIEAALAAGLRQADRIKDAFRNLVLCCSRLDFFLTGARCHGKGIRDRYRQREDRAQKQRRSADLRLFHSHHFLS